jgi:CheY-like chemotaxis protein
VAKKILLVDDTETILALEKMMLRDLGCEIITAKNGAEAVKAVHEHHPDVVLLDVVMPEMGGIEACRVLKGDPRTSGVPIIMVTTRGETDFVTRAFKAGCNDYLTKPIDRLELLAKIEVYIADVR